MKKVMLVTIALLAGWSFGQDQETVAQGLKEALKVGLKNAVTQVGIEDGYYGNDLIRIPIPDKMNKVVDFLDKIGAEKLTESLVKRMNRAAETAAPQALDIFHQALKDMKITDAANILSGDDHAATEYLQASTSEILREKFGPIVRGEMEKIQAIKLYNEMIEKYQTNPFASKIKLDISDYVTGKALDGLFTVVGEQEAKIRNDPKAQVTSLLRSIFGKN